jgi:uncharacterized protein YyaL (SSP411 family)
VSSAHESDSAPGTRRANRLAREVSPYLLQHAHNPVDWYPWGPEALERAVREDKPIVLSIGYSACHWCHVMERESFESESIAATMNERFVCIKVDREERPDLDHVYQLVVQLMGRSGGWPLTVFLTPDQRPFFGGTYFPPADRYGMPGFPKVLAALSEAYRTKRDQVEAQAEEIAGAIARVGSGVQRRLSIDGVDRSARGGSPLEGGGRAGSVSPEAVAQAVEKLGARFDETHGGFGQRPKFPSTMPLELLLRTGDPTRVAQVKKALSAMRAGGIWDHLGGGFHRYSTDERWLVPHFEKMLYDNALLLRLYADAWRATGEAAYADTARAIAAYVAREMTSPEGGFYATQDADSEGEEGKFFVWTPAQIDDACGDDEEAARAAQAWFDVTELGNFEGTGASVLSTPEPEAQVAASLQMTVPVFVAARERARARMMAVRETRPKPFRDEKILASWNGLMASALAQAGASLDEPALVQAAVRALEFVEKHLFVREDTALRALRLWKDGEARGPGFLDDHAFVADAALDVHEATGDPRWIAMAAALAEGMGAHFRDETDGSYFFSPDDAPSILVRPKDPFDHAVPSGAAIANRVFLRLGTLRDAKYAARGERAVENLAPEAAANPQGMAVTLALMDRLVRGSVDVALVGGAAEPRTQALARAVHRAYLPDRVLAWIDPADPTSVAASALFAEGKTGGAAPVAYVCRNRTCSLPMADPAELAEALASRAETPRLI